MTTQTTGMTAQNGHWTVGETAGQRTYTLRGPGNEPYQSSAPGTLGGHWRGKLYGCLDCPSALRAIARGHYVQYRVFFADEATAIAAGYRPCAVCLPTRYQQWKTLQRSQKSTS
jgi:hypothetical protein